MYAMKWMVSCMMNKGIKFGYAKSITKNIKENENYSQEWNWIWTPQIKIHKANQVIRGVPKRNEKNWKEILLQQ